MPSFANGCFSWSSQNIVLNTINWSLGSTQCTDYDHTAQSTNLQAGSSYPMSVTNGSWCGCAVWIDFDNSFTFDPGENLFYLYSAIATQTYNFNITIPALTPNGSYRMRVISPWGSDGFTPGQGNGWGGCGSFQYGNFDDFTINISAPCASTSYSFSATACDNYRSPSGLYSWTQSGVYNDTIPNAVGCDSLLTVTLDIYTITYDTLTPYACGDRKSVV